MKTSKIKSNGLTSVRTRLGLSQAQMAIYLKVNLSTIKQVELGQRTLSTPALIRLAEMEINMMDEQKPVIDDCIHPEELVFAKEFEEKFEELFDIKYKTGYKTYFLEMRLESMLDRYKSTREKIRIFESILKDGFVDDGNKEGLEKQYAMYKAQLSYCGLPMQELLRCRIALIKALHELYDNLKQQFKQDLPACLFTDSNTTST